MLDPLSELIAVLNRTGCVDASWRARHAPRGDLTAVWRTCEVPRVMAKVLYMTGRDDDAARAVEATQRALDDARREAIPPETTRIRACAAIREVVPTPPTLDELARAFVR